MSTTEWIAIVGAMLILPVIIIPVSIIMTRLGRGFNTFSRAALTRQAQIFAAKMCGGMLLRFGLIMLVFILAGGGIGFAFLESETVTTAILWAIIVVPTVLIIIPVILTELAVRRHFDKDGKPYNHSNSS